MPPQTPAPVAPAAPVRTIQSAADYVNQSDEELAAAIQRPAAAKAAQKVEPEAPAEPPAEPAPLEVAAEPAPKSAEEPAAEPTAAVAPAAPEPPKPAPLTEFSVYDAEGELEPPLELKFKFKASGKDYANVPLDKVVKMAQMGYYNEEREQQVLAAKQFVAEAQRHEQEYKQQQAEIERHVDRLLTDEAFRQRAIEIYQQQNSPEQRAQRAEAELHQERERQQQQGEVQRVATFVQQELTPRITRLIEAHPTVSEQEVVGYYTMLTAPLLVNGRVPTERFPEVIRLVDTDLTHWVTQKHESAAAKQTAQQQQVQAAQTQAAKAKRLVARKVAPPVASAPATQKPQKFNTAAEWLKTRLPMDYDNE